MGSSRAPWLVANNGQAWPLERETRLTIGRAPANNITLKDSTVSQKHAQITVSSGQIVVTDLGSANGVYVNGRRIDQPQQLRPGDTMQIGGVTFQLEDADSPTGTPVKSPAATASPMVWQLSGNGATYTIQEGQQISAGRSPANQIVVNDPGVSKKHAAIRVQDGRVYVADQNSANGTFIDGQRLDQPAQLNPDQTLMIGPAHFRLQRAPAGTATGKTRSYRQFLYISLGVLALFLVLFAMSGSNRDELEPTAENPAGSDGRVSAETIIEEVIAKIDGTETDLGLNESVSLEVGDGVTVIDLGRALLTFSRDQLRVEVLRDGNIVLQQFTADSDGLQIKLFQTLGATINNFSAEDAIDARLEIETDFAIIEATGTEFLVDYEEGTPLEWVVALEAGPDDLVVRSKNEGTPRTLAAGEAVWVAPIGPASEPIAADMDRVNDWIDNLQEGDEVLELGEVLLPRAQVDITTANLQPPLNAGDTIRLGGVTLTLEGGGSYTVEDCTGDGRNEIRVQNGSILFDVRPVNNRVRELHARIFNYGQPDQAMLLGYNPAGPDEPPLDRASARTGGGAPDIISINSSHQPYHFARIRLEDGCFSELLLTHPEEDDSLTPEPTITPTPYPGVPTPYAPGSGSVMPCSSLRESVPVTFEWGAPESRHNIERYEIEARVTYRDGGQSTESFDTSGSTTSYNAEFPCDAEQVDWILRAVDSAGSVGAWSDTAYFLIRLDPLPPPNLLEPVDGVEISCVYETYVELDWEPVGDASGISLYEIEINFAGIDSELQDTVFGDVSEYGLYVPCDAGIVYWQVRAIDGTDMAGEWSETYFYVESDLPPPPPDPLEPVDGTEFSCVYETYVELDWESVEDASGISLYEIEVYFAGLDSETQDTVSGNVSEYGFYVPCDAGTVYWKVRAIDGTDMVGEWSRDAYFYVVSDPAPPPPNPVEPDYGTEISCDYETYVVLDWEPVEDASGISLYEIEVYFAGFDSESQYTASGDVSDYGFYVPCDAEEVNWRVRAIDGTDVAGEWSRWAYFYVVPIETGPPDLVITSISRTGDVIPPPYGVDEYSYEPEVPIAVIVYNQGDSATESDFKISVDYEDESEYSFGRPFTVEGQEDSWYPFVAGLEPGESAVLNGIVTFSRYSQGTSIILWATVDSCAGEEFVEAHCRVLESDEENNSSGTISVEIPYFYSID